MITARLLLAFALATTAAACQRPVVAQAKAETPAKRGPVLSFSYHSVDKRPISTEALAGRVSVIGFLATYDMASQLQARHLGNLGRHHSPRLNVAALALEPAENALLVEAFSRTLSLPFPMAIADADTIAGRGPFAGLHHVPSVVILDREGREAWRHVGLVDEAELEAAVRKIEATNAPPPP